MTTQLNIRSLTSLLVSLVAICGIAAHVTSASAAEGMRSVRVSYADLNLANSQGIAKLYTRLRIAAGEVCGPEPEHYFFAASADWNACRQDALTRAIGTFGNPALIALHQQKTGVTPATLVADNGKR